MLASSATQLPNGAGWSYEVKWDGYRTLALKDESRVQLLSRNLKDATRLYPAITREVGRLRACLSRFVSPPDDRNDRFT